LPVDAFACSFLPGQEFFLAHAIARTSLGEGKKTSPDRRYYFKFIAKMLPVESPALRWVEFGGLHYLSIRRLEETSQFPRFTFRPAAHRPPPHHLNCLNLPHLDIPPSFARADLK
jgi:hypothetical protein